MEETQSLESLDALAREFNIEVWKEKITTVDCKFCGVYSVPHDAAHNGLSCPSCETTVTENDLNDTDEDGWFWWTCVPGCLPDSDVSGPFSTQRECLENATEGLEPADT